MTSAGAPPDVAGGWGPPAAVLPVSPGGGTTAGVRRLLSGSGRYLLRDWIPSLGWEASPDGGLRIPADRLRDVTLVRGGGMAALAHAVGSAGAYDPELVDVAAARAQGLSLVAALVAAHRTAAGPGGWGGDWQSPLWAAQLGLAAWLLGDAVDPSVRQALGVLVADEADTVSARPVQVLRDPRGQVLRPGDSASEEVSWEARLLSLAVLALPGRPQVPTWRRAQVARQLAAFAVPADVHRDERVHGWALCAWLPGSNVEPDGSIVNHHRIHPGYMRFPNAAAAVLHAALAGVDWSLSAVRGLDRVYACLVDRHWPSPPYDAPGGTSYVRDSAEVYFPSGNDWGTAQPVQFLLQDVQAYVLGLDGLASVPARRWTALRLAAVRQQAARFDDGRIYASFEEMRTELREPDAAAKLAEAWLTLVLSGGRGGVPAGEDVGRVLARRVPDPVLDPPEDARPPCRSRPLPRFPDTDGDVATAAGWLAARGVLHGRGDGTFGPTAAVTWEQLLLALFRRAGRPDVPGAYAGLDPASETGRAARWAAARGLVARDGDLAAPLRRDALALVLWLEAGGPPAPPLTAPDVDPTSDTGRALAWAVATGLLQGARDGSLNPAATVTRGQTALVLWRQAGRPRA